MELKDEAIVLDTVEVGEADLLVSLLCKERGREKCIAKHAKKSKRRFPNCLCAGNWIEVRYQLRPQRELGFLLEARLIRSFFTVGSPMANHLFGSYALKFVEYLTPMGEREVEVFELLAGVFEILPKSYRSVQLLCFEARLSKLLGYGINLKECLVCKRQYSYQGTAWFYPEKGGIVCGRCRPKAETIPLEPKEVYSLNAFQEHGLSCLSDLGEMAYTENLSKAQLRHLQRHLSPLPKGLLELRKKLEE